MTFPLSSTMEFTVAFDLAIALALGIGFGFALERAGFGSARKLTAVFYLYDMAGMLNLADLYIEPTSLVAQAVGGLVFGAGFIIGGYCPGTSIAAMATGRKDGIAFALGMLAGVLAYVELTPGIDDWIKANAQGEMTLPSVTGLSMGWFALAFIAFLLFAAWGMKQLEGRFGHLRPGG
jgi:uncharacterized protein